MDVLLLGLCSKYFFFFTVWVIIGLVPEDASDMILWEEDRLLLWKCCSSAYILKSCQIISFCFVQFK